MLYDGHFIQTFLIVLLLTVIPVLQGPAGDDVLHQHGVALHEDRLRHEADGGPLQLPDLHVHRAQLNNGILVMSIKSTEMKEAKLHILRKNAAGVLIINVIT